MRIPLLFIGEKKEKNTYADRVIYSAPNQHMQSSSVFGAYPTNHVVLFLDDTVSLFIFLFQFLAKHITSYFPPLFSAAVLFPFECAFVFVLCISVCVREYVCLLVLCMSVCVREYVCLLK